jgi:diamine N-acetyltransferase
MAENRGSEQPIVNLAGERVALGPLRRDLIPLYHRWSNDVVVSRTLGVGWPTTLEQETAAYERRTASDRDAAFTVYERATLRPVGLCSLAEIDHRHRRATFGITIGEADSRGKGHGAEATALTLEFAFTALGLSNVMLTCFEFNLAGRRAYERAGFREFGRRRRCSHQGGKLWDLIYMECLADEFVGSHLAQVFGPDEARVIEADLLTDTDRTPVVRRSSSSAAPPGTGVLSD